MSPRDARALLLDQALLQVRWAGRDAEEAVTPMTALVERLLTLLTGEGPLDEHSRREAAEAVLGLLSHLQFQDRQRQRLEHVELALALAQENGAGETQLRRLSERLTLPEEQRAWERLRAGESLQTILAEERDAPSASDGVELF